MKAVRPSRSASRESPGFTLIEALASVALMSALVYFIAVVTSQWLPNWAYGFGRVERAQMLDLGLRRVVDDLAATKFIPPGGGSRQPLFVGTETMAILVRDSVAPNEVQHLEIIRLAETTDERGFVLVRQRASFHPTERGDQTTGRFVFADSVPLVRAPYRVTFSYAGPDRVWRLNWLDNPLLPSAIRISVRDAASNQILTVSTATLVHVTAAADCVSAKSTLDCVAGKAPAKAEAPGAATSEASPVEGAK